MKVLATTMFAALAVSAVGGHYRTDVLATLQPRVISNDPCAQCRVTAVKTRSVGGVDSPMRSGVPDAIASSGSGTMVVVDRNSSFSKSAEMPMVFSAQGKFVRHLARRGQGPGELDRPRWAEFTAGDTLRVYEPNRVSLFTGPEMKFVRTIPFAPPHATGKVQLVRAGSERYVIHYLDGSKMNHAALHDAQGRLVRDFGELKAATTGRHTRVALPSGLDGVALLMVDFEWFEERGYRISRVMSNGRVEGLYVRRPDWWLNRDKIMPGQKLPQDSVLRQATAVANIFHRQDDILFVLSTRPKPEWNKVRLGDQWSLYRTVLEVLDLTSGELLGSVDVEGHAVQMLDRHTFAVVREDGSGVPFIDIWRITVVR